MTNKTFWKIKQRYFISEPHLKSQLEKQLTKLCEQFQIGNVTITIPMNRILQKLTQEQKKLFGILHRKTSERNDTLKFTEMKCAQKV